MNRAFLLILIPAIVVAAAYLGVSAYLGLRLNVWRFAGAGLAFGGAVAIVYFMRRRKARPRSN